MTDINEGTGRAAEVRAPGSVTSPGPAEYVYIGRTEVVATIVGLVTGALYSWLDLPIPAPNVFGGILAIIFTFIGYVIIQKSRGVLAFGPPPK